MKNIHYFIFKPSFSDGKLVAIFPQEKRVEAFQYLQSIWKWMHKAEIKEAEWDGGEFPSDNQFHSIAGTFSPVELIDLPVNPTINMNEDSIKNRKQAIVEWMTRSNNYSDHKDKSICSYCGHPANSSTCQKSHP
jgi:hypothetical protein